MSLEKFSYQSSVLFKVQFHSEHQMKKLRSWPTIIKEEPVQKKTRNALIPNFFFWVTHGTWFIQDYQ